MSTFINSLRAINPSKKTPLIIECMSVEFLHLRPVQIVFDNI